MDVPNVGDICVWDGYDPIELVWPATLERPLIVMLGTHIWTGEHWMPFGPSKEHNG